MSAASARRHPIQNQTHSLEEASAVVCSFRTKRLILESPATILGQMGGSELKGPSKKWLLCPVFGHRSGVGWVVPGPPLFYLRAARQGRRALPTGRSSRGPLRKTA